MAPSRDPRRLRSAISHLESLDQHGLLTKVLPEWEAVRSKPQRNAYHTFTAGGLSFQ